MFYGLLVLPFSVPVYIAQPKFVPPSKPAVATPTSSGGAPGQNTCRFYPDCKNMNCTFYHPKVS